MENKLEKSSVKYNHLQSLNKNLRSEIDVMRKQMRTQHRVNKSLTRDIRTHSDKALKLNQSSYQGQRVYEETNN